MSAHRDGAVLRLTDAYGDALIFERLGIHQGRPDDIASVRMVSQDDSGVVYSADELHALLGWLLDTLGIHMVGVGPSGVSQTFGTRPIDTEDGDDE